MARECTACTKTYDKISHVDDDKGEGSAVPKREGRGGSAASKGGLVSGTEGEGQLYQGGSTIDFRLPS